MIALLTGPVQSWLGLADRGTAWHRRMGIGYMAGVAAFHEELAVAAWACWAVPLLMTELVIQGRKVLAVRAS